MRQKLCDRLAAQVVEHGFGDHRIAGCVERHFGQLVRRIAQSRELLAKDLLVQGEFLRLLQRFLPLDRYRVKIIGECDFQMLADMSANMPAKPRAANDFISREGMLQALSDRGIIGLPDHRARSNRVKVYITSTQFDFEALVSPRIHCKDATTLLILLGMPLIKHNPIPRLQRRCHFRLRRAQSSRGNENASSRHVNYRSRCVVPRDFGNRAATSR